MLEVKKFMREVFFFTDMNQDELTELCEQVSTLHEDGSRSFNPTRERSLESISKITQAFQKMEYKKFHLWSLQEVDPANSVLQKFFTEHYIMEHYGSATEERNPAGYFPPTSSRNTRDWMNAAFWYDEIRAYERMQMKVLGQMFNHAAERAGLYKSPADTERDEEEQIMFHELVELKEYADKLKSQNEELQRVVDMLTEDMKKLDERGLVGNLVWLLRRWVLPNE